MSSKILVGDRTGVETYRKHEKGIETVGVRLDRDPAKGINEHEDIEIPAEEVVYTDEAPEAPETPEADEAVETPEGADETPEAVEAPEAPEAVEPDEGADEGSEGEPGESELGKLDAEALSDQMTRPDLNQLAADLGIESPEEAPNKLAVAKMIVAEQAGFPDESDDEADSE